MSPSLLYATLFVWKLHIATSFFNNSTNSNNTNSIKSFNTTLYYSTTETAVKNCTNKFECNVSQSCINTWLVCDGQSDCPNNEDESKYCQVCIGIGDSSDLYGGQFDYFSYDTKTKSIIYQNSFNNYYLHPTSTGYDINTNYNNPSNWEFTCFIDNKMDMTIDNCQYWMNSSYNIVYDIFININCNGCAYQCVESGLCINEQDVCNGVVDCYLEDDETDCTFCFESYNSSFSYLDGIYSFFIFDTIYNGTIFYDDVGELYLYPKIE
eukprot:529924_1